MLDPLELVRQAKNRHHAYKFGSDYTPQELGGKDITQDPAGAAELTAQGVSGANTPSAGGEASAGFAGGGEVIGKVTKIIKDLLDRFGPEALPSTIAKASPTEARALPNAEEKLHRIGSQLNPETGVDPYNTVDFLAKQRETDDLLGSALAPQSSSMLMQPGFLTTKQAFAGGGDVQYGDSDLAREIAATPPTPPVILRGSGDHSGGSNGGSGEKFSSLKWLADMARKLGPESLAEDRARLATGVAKQFYGLDEQGDPVLGGHAWLSSQHGTPPRILDELTSIPGNVVDLVKALNGPGPKGTESPNDLQWSHDAARRLDALDRRVKEVTGVGDAHTLPEHIEDAAGMLATPIPAARVAKEAPMLQRALEYFTPVRPPTLSRYATDSAALGSVSTGLDKLANLVAAKKKPDNSVDPEFEEMAMNNSNSYAGGGKILDLAAKLAELVRKTAPEASQGGKDLLKPVQNNVVSMPRRRASSIDLNYASSEDVQKVLKALRESPSTEDPFID